MAPRQRSRTRKKPSREKLHVEELDEPATSPRGRRAPDSPRKGTRPFSGALEARILQGAGALGLFVGFGLWAGTGLHEGIASAANTLTQVGLHAGTLVVGSFLLFAFGRIRSGQVEAARRAAQGQEDGLLEQMASEQVREHQAMERLARALADLGGGQQDLGVQLQLITASLDQVRQDKAEDTQAQEAIFRLAASLDQLGARVEQRMQRQYDAFQAGLQKVGEEIVQAQKELRTLLKGLPTRLPAPSETEPEAESGRSVEEAPDPQPAGAPAGSGSEEGTTAAAEPTAQVDDSGVSLGVLDTIPDEDPSLPPVHASSTSLPAEERGPEAGDPQAPLPSATADGAGIILDDHKTPAERAADLDASTKLTQLKDLLADERLRAALDEMRRNS